MDISTGIVDIEKQFVFSLKCIYNLFNFDIIMFIKVGVLDEMYRNK